MHTKTCSWMFIATLSIIVKTCNQSRCPSVGEWINCGITHMYSFAQLCLTLCDPMDCSPPGFSACGISQARILKWLPFPSSEDLSDPSLEPAGPALQASSCIGRRILYYSPYLLQTILDYNATFFHVLKQYRSIDIQISR